MHKRLDAAVGNLTGLTSLVMRLGGAGGQLPSSLSLLKNLKVLFVTSYFAPITSSIPPQLSLLTSLTRLDLGAGNKIHGEIPKQLSTLSRLVSLSLANNLLGNVIPQQLSVLTLLTMLNLQANQLTGLVPPQLSALTLLQSLNLDHNSLTGTLPIALSFMYPNFGPFFLASNIALCGSDAGFPGINTKGTHLGQACQMPPREFETLASWLENFCPGCVGPTF